MISSTLIKLTFLDKKFRH